jgi:hypothetical protein
VDDGVAAGDVAVKLVERLGPGWDEVLLHLHINVWPLEQRTQRVAAIAKLVGDGRQE